VKWNVIVVLMCISLIPNDVECVLGIYIPSLEKYLIPLLISKLDCFLLLSLGIGYVF
jgi:hypothetical protein